MSRIYRLPNAALAETQAAEWIARLHADDVSQDDLVRFETWCAAHPGHLQAYESLCGTVREVKRAGRLVRAVSFGNAMNAAADPSTGEAGRPVRARLGSRWRFAAAAALALLAVTVIWWTMRASPESSFQTGVGEHASVELPDGSRLDLNSNSMALIEITARARTIRLTRGEAFFEVAHDPQRPFWVVAGQSWIRAVGTAFNVDMRPSGVRIIVSEGTVKVAGGHATDATPSDASLAKASVSVLTAGQQAEIRAGVAEIAAVAPLEMTRLAAWRSGKLYFENQRLESVLEELARYTQSQIVIDDAAVRELPVGGTFQANPQGVEALLSMLREGFGLTIVHQGDSVIHVQSAAAPYSAPGR